MMSGRKLFAAVAVGLALAASNAHAAEPPRLARLSVAPSIGATTSHLVRLQGEATSAVPAGPAKTPELRAHRIDRSAVVHARVLATDASGWTVVVRLSDLSFLTDGAPDAERRGLTEPAIVRYSKDGLVQDMKFIRGIAPDAALAFRGLIESMQVAIPQDADNQWSTIERSGDIRFVTAYVRLPDEAGRVQVRRKRSAIASFTPSSSEFQGATASIERGTAELTLDPATGRLIDLHNLEHVVVKQGGRVTTGYRMEIEAAPATGPAPTLPSTLAEARKALATPRLVTAQLYDVEPDVAARVKGLTTAAVMKQFVTDVEANHARGLRLLRGYVRLNPARTLEVARALDAIPAADHASLSMGWAALASAGHKEAQAVLRNVVEQATWKGRSRQSVLLSLENLQAPERETARSVWRHYQAISLATPKNQLARSIAAHAYGALAIDSGQPELSAEIVQTLARRLAETRNDFERHTCVSALGNVGDFALVSPVLAPSFSSNDPGTRARAYRLFARIEGDEAFGAFEARYTKESDVLVRRAAADIVADMPDSASRQAWARRTVLETADTDTVLALVRVLGSSIANHPESAATLRQLLATQTKQKVRRAIYAFVAPQTGGRP